MWHIDPRLGIFKHLKISLASTNISIWAISLQNVPGKSPNSQSFGFHGTIHSFTKLKSNSKTAYGYLKAKLYLIFTSSTFWFMALETRWKNISLQQNGNLSFIIQYYSLCVQVVFHKIQEIRREKEVMKIFALSLTHDFQISHATLSCSLSPSIIYYFCYKHGTLNNHYKCFTFRFFFTQMKQLFARQWLY